MSSANRSLGLAALGWWLAARGLSEPIAESFFRLDPAGVQRLGKAGRVAALATTRRLAQALREEPGYGGDLFGAPSAWLDRLETLLNAPRAGLRLEKALVGDAEDFEALLAVEAAEDRGVMLAARLAEWLHGQVGGSDEPAALATLLAQGWPLAEGSKRRVTFVQEFLANLQMELSDAPPEITMPLGEPAEFLEWLQAASGHSAAREPAGATPLELPPPARPATPAPPIEVPTAQEGGAMDESVAAQEPPASPAAQPAMPLAAQSEALVRVHEEAAREHRRLRRWALVIQIAWVVLIFAGWRAFQKHRKALPAPPAQAASPAPSPSPSPSSPPPLAEKATPAPGRLTVRAAPATPLPTLPPPPAERSVGADELDSQAQALAAQGHHAEAVALFRRLVQVQAQDKGLGRLPRALVYARMAASLAALERLDEADASVERAQALLEELLPTHDAETALGVEMVADYWASRERWPLAARLYQKAVQAYEGTPAENSTQQLSTVNRLAGALRQIGELKSAEQLYRQLEKGYAGAGSAVATEAASAAHNLANVLFITNRPGEALRHYEQAFAWLAKAPPSDEQARRMATLMRANYERCLAATGIPPEEARERARKLALP